MGYRHTTATINSIVKVKDQYVTLDLVDVICIDGGKITFLAGEGIQISVEDMSEGDYTVLRGDVAQTNDFVFIDGTDNVRYIRKSSILNIQKLPIALGSKEGLTSIRLINNLAVGVKESPQEMFNRLIAQVSYK